jgi:hypothetical protein
MPNAGEVLVYVDNDGSVRELTISEKTYVETEFSPLDGARPYVKTNYLERNGWGEMRGFLPRTEVPNDVAVGPAPLEGALQPKTPQTVADSIAELIRRRGRDS